MTMDDHDWNLLLRRICKGACTPLIGAEAYLGTLRPRSKLATYLAGQYNFPLRESQDLARVANFIATINDPFLPHEEVSEWFRRSKPDFTVADEPHLLLAQMPFPVYIATNYDDYMFQALKSVDKDAELTFCRWNNDLRQEASVFDGDYKPTIACPAVFHLFGHAHAERSLVVTEDEYLDFLIQTTLDDNGLRRTIPPAIQVAFAQHSLLFLGYRMADLEFRVLMRRLLPFLKQQRFHCSVQLIHVDDSDLREGGGINFAQAACDYVRRYYSGAPLNFKVYDGNTADFVKELKARWDNYQCLDTQEIRS